MAESRLERPDWWDWELVFTSHSEVRMEERGTSEVELRAMLEDATTVLPARRPGRWIVHTRHAGSPWIVVVEPDPALELLLIVTAYPREPRR
jgi:hypothetical protein